MTEDGIARAIDRRPVKHLARRSPDATRWGVRARLFRTPVTRETLDDEARWLDGQVRAWEAGRAI